MFQGSFLLIYLLFFFAKLISGGSISMSLPPQPPQPPPGSGLKWVRVNLPQYRKPGELAQLQCDYDLGNDTLYAVKWYKENEEFYRFVPKERPPATSHKVDGVHVDISLSDNKKVVLRSVGLRTGGLYRCEVSAEAPSFASAQSEARMAVVSFPRDDPKISGVQTQYHIGDEIDLNCTSAKSYPASVLRWYINEQQVSSPALVDYPLIEHRHGLVTTVLGLRFRLDSRHFRGGHMKVKCIAAMAPLVWSDERASAVQKLPMPDMREALLLVKSTAESITHSSSMMIIVLLILLISKQIVFN